MLNSYELKKNIYSGYYELAIFPLMATGTIPANTASK